MIRVSSARGFEDSWNAPLEQAVTAKRKRDSGQP
jgi:hypothetical protein